MSLIPVEGHSGLYRDSNTNAIINKNKTEYESYKARKKKVDDEKNKIKNIEDELNDVKNDLNEIKILLQRLSEKWIQIKLV